jgi:hypothetical protein
MAISLFIVGSVAASCGSGGDDAGLKCKSGGFYLDGQEFTSCSQCSSSDCGFESDTSQTCTYPNGVQNCTVSSGTITARCAGQTATVVISNGTQSCGSGS